MHWNISVHIELSEIWAVTQTMFDMVGNFSITEYSHVTATSAHVWSENFQILWIICMFLILWTLVHVNSLENKMHVGIWSPIT